MTIGAGRRLMIRARRRRMAPATLHRNSPQFHRYRSDSVKTGESADRRNYAALCERLTSKPVGVRQPRHAGGHRADGYRAHQVRTRRLVDKAGFVRIEGMVRWRIVGRAGSATTACSKSVSNPATQYRLSAPAGVRMPAGRRIAGRYRGRCALLARRGAISCRIARAPRELQIVIRRVTLDQQAPANW